MRRRIPGTTALITFESAARHESFSKAADELALSQSAVCRQIIGLEAFLGVKLFRRTRRGVVLTESGRAYFRQVANRLDAIESDTLQVMAHQGQRTSINLAVMPTFATCWLLPRLNRFLTHCPEGVVNLSVQTRPFVFGETEFDAALYYGNAGWPGTEAYFLMHEQSVPVCSPALMQGRQFLTPDEIAGQVLLQQHTRPYAWRSWFQSLGQDVPGDMAGPRMELFTMLAQAAVCGMGIALISPMMIEDELRTGQLVVAMHHHAVDEKAYYFICPEQKAENPVLQQFRQWLEQEAAASDVCFTGGKR